MLPHIPEYRAFFFSNMYLSQIQVGIQAAHVTTKMFIEYAKWGACKQSYNKLKHWGAFNVTKDLRNGGYQSNLMKIYYILEQVCPILQIPFGKFHEEMGALNGALTSVGVVFDNTKRCSTYPFSSLGIDDLILTVDNELRGDGLSEIECYGILTALVNSCKRA